MRRTPDYTSFRLVFASDFVRDLTGRQVALNAITNAVDFFAPPKRAGCGQRNWFRGAFPHATPFFLGGAPVRLIILTPRTSLCAKKGSRDGLHREEDSMPVCLLKGDARTRYFSGRDPPGCYISGDVCTIIDPDEPGVPCDGYLCRMWRHSFLFPDEFGGGAYNSTVPGMYLGAVQNAFPQVLLLFRIIGLLYGTEQQQQQLGAKTTTLCPRKHLFMIDWDGCLCCGSRDEAYHRRPWWHIRYVRLILMMMMMHRYSRYLDFVEIEVFVRLCGILL